jgi:hypothetical protein
LPGDATWLTRAGSWTAGVESQEYDTTTHDVGYKIGPAYMNGWRFSGQSSYQDMLVTAAGSVATRRSGVVRCIRSQNDGAQAEFMVEIDNVPTPELLLRASAFQLRRTTQPLYADACLG